MKKNIIFTIFASMFAFTINYLINFYLIKFVTDKIGVNAYGYITLSKTLASYCTIVTTALNSYASRYIAVAYHKGEFKKANTYFNTVLFANISISICLLLICSVLLLFMGSFFDVPIDMINDVRMLFLLVFSNMGIILSTTAFQAASIIKDKLLIISLAQAFSYVAEALILILFYASFVAKVFYVGIAISLASIILIVVNIYITRKYTPKLIVNYKYFEKIVINKLVSNGIWYSINSLGNMLNSGLDLLVTNVLLGSISMGIVSIVKTFSSIFPRLFQMTSQPFQPQLLKEYTHGDIEKLQTQLIRAMKLCGLFSNLAFAGTVSLGYSYYCLWMPNQDCELLYRLTVIAVATSIFEGAVYPLYYVYNLTVKTKVPCMITIIGGLLNVLGMIILIKNTSLDVYSIFITTAIVMLIISGVSNPIYIAHCLNLPIKTFYHTLVQHTIACALETTVLKVFCDYFIITKWREFIIIAVCASILGIVLHFSIMLGISEIKQMLIKSYKLLNDLKNS